MCGLENDNIEHPINSKISDEEFRKQALLKAGRLAIAAQAVLQAQGVQFGFAMDQLDKVLKDYNNFIFDRVNDEYKIKNRQN